MKGHPLELCKKYIYRHLHERIYVRDIAEKIGIHENYLSGIFHRAEGITISAFIQKEKLHLDLLPFRLVPSGFHLPVCRIQIQWNGQNAV